ncbi:MAG: DUF4158 domain-containing protein [Pseudonocardiaceae bacterium]|nr:DUF4158 domain-containing protein [Pseudonocardiaceae bacterium]
MPVEFLSDAQVAAYGCFGSELPAREVERFFYLDEDAHDLIARRRVDSHRLGMGVQIGTVRAVGRFLEDPLEVPWPASEVLRLQTRHHLAQRRQRSGRRHRAEDRARHLARLAVHPRHPAQPRRRPAAGDGDHR